MNSSHLSVEDFLLSPGTGLSKENKDEDFVFSYYGNESETDSDSEDDAVPVSIPGSAK